jgi:predicted dehydrogenase
MLDPAVAGGGCLRNVGLHGLDLFRHILGEAAEVTGAVLSHRALGLAVEDYSAVTLRSADGVLGTVEVGTTFPFRGTPGPGDRRADQQLALAGRDALLVAQDGELRLVTAGAQTTMAGNPAEPPPLTMLRDTIAAWRDGRPPPVPARDCARAMALADAAYAVADETAP